MWKPIFELLAKSFDAHALVISGQKLLLPASILQAMGTHLQGSCHSSGQTAHLLVSKAGDIYLQGHPLAICGQCLILPQMMAIQLQTCRGDSLLCSYCGAGDFLIVQKGPL